MSSKVRSTEGRRTGETTPRTGEKALLSVRMPMELVEPGERALNLTRMVNTILDAFRTYFNLPVVLVERLEADRKALKLGRLEYLQHIVYMRSELVMKNGPGFDKGGAVTAKSGSSRT